jgi:hypothetical protein
LIPSRGKWAIDRTAGFRCEVEGCIFLGRIQELREQIKLYWSMEDEGMDHAGDHGEDDEADGNEA